MVRNKVASCQKGTIARPSSISFYRTLVNYAGAQTNLILVSMMCDYVCLIILEVVSRHYRYRGVDYIVAVYTNKSIERQNETLKFQCLDGYKNCSLSKLLTVLVE